MNLDLLEQEIVSGSSISWVYANLHLDPDTTIPASHHSVFTGQMTFLPPTNSVKALKAIFLGCNLLSQFQFQFQFTY